MVQVPGIRDRVEQHAGQPDILRISFSYPSLPINLSASHTFSALNPLEF